MTDTVATFRVIETLTGNPSVRVYFADGLPSGYDSFDTATIVPTLVSVSPSTGSSGGTLLTVTGTGFGTKNCCDDLNLESATSGSDICDEVNITGYGTFTCLTKAMEISSSDTIDLKISGETYACGNADNTACSFELLDSSSPTLEFVNIQNAASLMIEGSSFPTSDYDVVAIFMGIESSSGVISSEQIIEVTFDKGVPVS